MGFLDKLGIGRKRPDNKDDGRDEVSERVMRDGAISGGIVSSTLAGGPTFADPDADDADTSRSEGD